MRAFVIRVHLPKRTILEYIPAIDGEHAEEICIHKYAGIKVKRYEMLGYKIHRYFIPVDDWT